MNYAPSLTPTRRFVFQLAGTLLLCSSPLMRARAQRVAGAANLLTAPIEVGGDWGKSLPASALAVIERMRDVCLTDVMLVSDRQPDTIHVDDHSSGRPSIWLHFDNSKTAWIIVDVGERAWCQLAYQFGHELGHVLCNSWLSTSRGSGPCRWLEESMVEAFSIRGLGLLSKSWAINPPFPADNAYARAINQYREEVIDKYASVDASAARDLAGWFRRSRSALEQNHGLNRVEGPGILAVLEELEHDDLCVADLGAVNRWPEQSEVPLEDYLARWSKSCAQIGAAGRLPRRLGARFGLRVRIY